MVRLPLSPAELERGARLGALLRRARGGRSMLDTALDAGVSPETLRKIESGRVATPAFQPVCKPGTRTALRLASRQTGLASLGRGLRNRP